MTTHIRSPKRRFRLMLAAALAAAALGCGEAVYYEPPEITLAARGLINSPGEAWIDADREGYIFRDNGTAAQIIDLSVLYETEWYANDSIIYITPSNWPNWPIGAARYAISGDTLTINHSQKLLRVPLNFTSAPPSPPAMAKSSGPNALMPPRRSGTGKN